VPQRLEEGKIVVGRIGTPAVAQALQRWAVGDIGPRHPEGYLLYIGSEGIVVAGRDEAGVRHGAYSLAQVIADSDSGLLPALVIHDWPDFRLRGVYLTQVPWREIGDYWEALRRVVDFMAAHKMNFASIGVKLEKNVDEYRDFIAYARSKGIEVEPVRNPSSIVLNAHPEWRVSKVFDPAIKEAYPILRDYYTRLCRTYQPKRVNIVHDEYVTAYDYTRRTPFYAESIAADKMKPWELLALELNNIYNILKDNGVGMSMWADSMLNRLEFVCKTPGPLTSGIYGGPPDNLWRARYLIPKDIVMWDWHYCVSNKYPTMKLLMDLGFPVVGVPWWEDSSYTFAEYARSLNPRPLGMMGVEWLGKERGWDHYLEHIAADAQHFWSHSEPRPVLKHVLEVGAHNPLHSIAPGKFDIKMPLDYNSGAFLWAAGRTLAQYDTYHPRGPDDDPGMYLKADRHGEFFVDLQTAEGGVFDQLQVTVDSAEFCPRKLLVSTDDGNTFQTVVEEMAGPKPTIAVPQAQGQNQVRLCLQLYNPSKERATVLRGLRFRGVVVRER